MLGLGEPMTTCLLSDQLEYQQPGVNWAFFYISTTSNVLKDTMYKVIA